MDSIQLTKAIAALNIKLTRQMQAVEATKAQIEAFTEIQTAATKKR